ncbi:spermidine synthase [Marinobacter sp. ELB17]|uniref:spermidine synthase n=1 Tax=Marinobacter sp. ELB17 TaxID=270374 RepID=UPI0000F39A7B|nr:hypothetical protein [Marinobacter sp. ELB17]EAZ99859.1 Spermidine synthase [Marinobacter sp. ELB17]
MPDTLWDGFCLGNKIAEFHDGSDCVEVFDNSYERYFTFGSVYEQSCQRKDDPGFLMHEHTRAMLLPLIFDLPRRATVLGLGGGSLVNCLFHRFPDMELTAVELRQSVIDVAHDFFQVPTDPRLSIFCEDAGHYLARSEKRSTDLLFCDIYNAYGMDPQQCRADFLSRCHDVLDEGGWAVFNFFNYQSETGNALRLLDKKFEAVFTCHMFTGNLIVLASKVRPGQARAEFKSRALSLEKHLGFPILNHFLRLTLFRGGNHNGSGENSPFY